MFTAMNKKVKIYPVEKEPLFSNPRKSRFAEKPSAEKSNGRIRSILGASALIGALGLASFLGNQGGEAPTPLSTTETTMVTAEEGDSLLGLQQKEGLNGMPADEARQKLSELNGGTDIMPGQNIVLMDNLDNNPPVEE